MKYYLIAGEASGDLHASNLMKSIKNEDPQAEFRFFGGDLMLAQGGTLVKHYRDMAFMGMDVIFHLREIFANIKFCQQDLMNYQPDVLILVDYPGFNLRIAEFAHNNQIKVYYYISPKVWAWKEGRVKKIKQFVDKLYIIFPFEIEYFKKFGIETEYYGNPLNDSIHQFNSRKEGLDVFLKKNNLPQQPIIALVAGSRKGEIKRLLPEMLAALKDFTNHQLIITGAPSIDASFYEFFIKGKNVNILYGQTYEVMSYAEAAVVTSGTATLETALLKTPEVVVFKASKLSYAVGKMLVTIKFFSLVNLIVDRLVVKELLQFNLARDIKAEIELILSDKNYREKMLKDFDLIESMLGEPGVAERIAKSMVQSLRTKNQE